MTSSPPITAHLAAELPHAGEGGEVAALDGDLPGVAPYVPGGLLAPLLAPAGEDDLDTAGSAHRRLHTAGVTLAPRSARPRAVSLPMPVLAPVTMATHPVRSTCSRYLHYLHYLYTTLRFSVTSSGYFVVSGQCYSFYVAVPVSAGRNLS